MFDKFGEFGSVEEFKEAAGEEENIENITEQAEIVTYTPLEESKKLINPKCEPELKPSAADLERIMNNG